MAAIRRLHDRYVHFKHRLASANIRLAAHVAKRFRHHALSYSDLLQEAVCGLMQAIDRFDVSHGTRLATYATWWIRQTLQIAVARQSHLVSLSPHHLQELGLLQQESEALAHGGQHLPSPQELARPTGSSLAHLTLLQTRTAAPVSLNAVLDDDSDFKLTEAMPDNESQTLRTNSERQEALSFLMEKLRPRERKVLDLRFGLTGGTHSLRQIGHCASNQQGTRSPDSESGTETSCVGGTRWLGAGLLRRLIRANENNKKNGPSVGPFFCLAWLSSQLAGSIELRWTSHSPRRP